MQISSEAKAELLKRFAENKADTLRIYFAGYG